MESSCSQLVVISSKDPVCCIVPWVPRDVSYTYISFPLKQAKVSSYYVWPKEFYLIYMKIHYSLCEANSCVLLSNEIVTWLSQWVGNSSVDLTFESCALVSSWNKIYLHPSSFSNSSLIITCKIPNVLIGDSQSMMCHLCSISSQL